MELYRTAASVSSSTRCEFFRALTEVNTCDVDIAAVLDLEIASQSSGDSSGFDVADLAPFQLEQGNPINLASDGSDKVHALQYGITINLDKTAKD